MAHSRGYRIVQMAINDIADTQNESLNENNIMENTYPVLESVENKNNTGNIDNENNFNPNNMVVVQDQSNGSLFDIANIPIMLVDDFVDEVSEFNLENYVSISTTSLDNTIKETNVNVSLNTQQPISQKKIGRLLIQFRIRKQ